MTRVIASIAACLALFVSACGGGDKNEAPPDPIRNVPDEAGIREKIKLSLKGGKLVLNGNSRVIVADVKASNGVIHAIDTVLVPPCASLVVDPRC